MVAVGMWLIILTTNQGETVKRKSAAPVVLNTDKKTTTGSPKINSGRTKSSVDRNSIGIKWIRVEGGRFTMGNKMGTGDSDEEPEHTVVLKTFYLSSTEVTFRQYDAFCDAAGYIKPSDGGSGRGNKPVINITYKQARKFCEWMGGRLPTEAEWEYAASGGQKSAGFRFAGSNELKDVAWFKGNSGGVIQIVGGKHPNELGIYDMSGNVWEWCSDYYATNYYRQSPENDPECTSNSKYRVRRGGSCYSELSECRNKNRGMYYPNWKSEDTGFRVCRDKPMP